MKKIDIPSLLQASTVIIDNPINSVRKVLGVNDYTDIIFLTGGPLAFLGRKTYLIIKEKIKKDQEKERIYREIICKQQAAINRQKQINRELEMRLRQMRNDSAIQQQEIENLKHQLKNLDEIIYLLGKAAQEV